MTEKAHISTSLRTNCTPKEDLEELMLQGHVALRLKTNTGTEDVCQSTALLSKSVDDRRSWRSQGSLQHVAENAKDAVEILEVLGGSAVVGMSLPLDASHHLGDEHKINDQWRREKRVLANIENPRHIRTTHDANEGMRLTRLSDDHP